MTLARRPEGPSSGRRGRAGPRRRLPGGRATRERRGAVPRRPGPGGLAPVMSRSACMGPSEEKGRLRRLLDLAVLGGCAREQAAETLAGTFRRYERRAGAGDRCIGTKGHTWIVRAGLSAQEGDGRCEEAQVRHGSYDGGVRRVQAGTGAEGGRLPVLAVRLHFGRTRVRGALRRFRRRRRADERATRAIANAARRSRRRADERAMRAIANAERRSRRRRADERATRAVSNVARRSQRRRSIVNTSDKKNHLARPAGGATIRRTRP